MTAVTANTRRPNTPIPPPTKEDGYAAAEKAAENFITAVRRAIDRLPAASDLNAAANELTEAWRQVGADAKPTLTAASTAVGIYWNRPANVTDEVRRTDARAYLPACLAAVDAALAGAAFTRRGELNRAQAEVATLEAEQRRLLTALEEAVSTGDVDRVMEIRPQVEVRLPAQRDAARLEAAELELEQAEAQRDRPRRRAEAAAHAQQAAQETVHQAQRRLQEAEAALQAATVARSTADHAAQQAAQSARALATEVERLRQANSKSLAERLRRFAGLPATTTTNGDAR